MTADEPADRPEHLDVLVVGAGLSGVGAGCHLRMKCPGKTFAILEARESIGGTWDLFRYPGVRCDSDIYTLGYPFRPWLGESSIVSGPEILDYIRETAEEYGLSERIRLRHRVISADWSSTEARWTVRGERVVDGSAEGEAEPFVLTAGFILCAVGYYSYERGYAPEFAAQEDFAGQIVHPQFWPEDLEVSGRRVAVIGSGATAITLVPALAERGARVTMVQRTPSYVVTMPSRDRVAGLMRKVLPEGTAHRAIRRKNQAVTAMQYRVSRSRPDLMKKLMRGGAVRELPDGFDVDTHFSPPYEPWDQRVCIAVDGDFFAAIRDRGASIVTGEIERLIPEGILMASGEVVPAEVIVTATGLEMLPGGGIAMSVDGAAVALKETVSYKGMMFSGIPNLAVALGYANASWTLKCDLIEEYVCRMLTFMDERGYVEAMPQRPPDDEPTEQILPLTSGYVQRAMHLLPRQGARSPWRSEQDYRRDRRLFRDAPLEDEGIRFR